MNLPTIDIDRNAARVSLGPVTLWFSYRTLIAFDAPGCGLVVRQNEWAQTTGKHLNAIDGGNKAARVDGKEFADLFDRHVSIATDPPVVA